MAAEVYDMASESYDPASAVGTNYVRCKEDLEYEELSTLEGLLSLFEHDKALDIEIANLKEDCLFNTIRKLEDKVTTLENSLERHTDTIESLTNENNDLKSQINSDAVSGSIFSNALMLMAYINPADIPDHQLIDMIAASKDNPSTLLQYIPEDVEIGWGVKTILNQKAVTINHGLMSKDAADKEDA